MDMEILNNVENKLYDRIEILAKIVHKNSSTPKRDEIRKEISARLNKDLNLIVVKKISTIFGKQESLVKVYIYNNKDVMMKIEPKYILKRNGIVN